METRWRIELLGGLGAHQGERVITRFRTQKTGALLAYLAYYLHRGHGFGAREALIDMLWPEADPRAGRHTLSQALSALRHQFEPPGTAPGAVIVADRSSVRLNPMAVTTDVAEFGAAVSSAAGARSGAERVQLLMSAVESYRGELLPGYYEPWVLGEREALAESYFQALSELLALLEEAGELHRALDHARRGVSVDPLREEAHQDLMRLLVAAGQPAAALRQYRELERLLRHELGDPPHPATRALAGEAERRALLRSSSDPEELSPAQRAPRLEPVGGAVPLGSAFYVVRPLDMDARYAIARRESIVLIKGARGMGKTSLLARLLQEAREAGAIVLLTDLQKLNDTHLQSVGELFLTLAEWMAMQLGLELLPREAWNAGCGPNINFEQYLRREFLDKFTAPVVWGLDDADRLFPCAFAAEVFALFRSWHNARALDPRGPWARLTMAITYATEAHLYLHDLNQSPFNVGTRLTLEDFTLPQVAHLNRRYGSPLRNDAEIDRFFRLVGGHPDLVRRGLHEMAARRSDIAALETQAQEDGGIFGHHLRRLYSSLARNPELCDVVRQILQGGPCPTSESFYRLRTAGVITGASARDVRPRCQLYATYLERSLR